MNPVWIFHIWTNGDISETITLDVNQDFRHFAQTYLVKKSGDGTARAYIHQYCRRRADDVVACEVDDSADARSTDFLSAGHTRVTFKLRTTGGSAKSSGAIYRR